MVLECTSGKTSENCHGETSGSLVAVGLLCFYAGF